MGQIIGRTESLCPECLARIPAVRVEQEGDVYLRKRCSQHGNYQVIIWRGDAESYTEWEQFARDGDSPIKTLRTAEKGCPYDCGLCPSHQVDACTMVMEVTSECNLNCPICFANAGKGSPYEPDIDTVIEMYRTVMDTVGRCTIQLSGGEPTLRDDLPQIVSLGQEMGFNHILVNTNGIRLAKDRDYLKRLKNSGLSAVYLQFDGVSDDVYRFIRGADLFYLKNMAIDNCLEQKIGVILVPVLIPGVNTHQVGDIFRFAKTRIQIVKGIHFQPISYLGRYPTPPSDKDRITIPEVISALIEQTGGELKKEDFLPRWVKSSHCSFSGLFALAQDGRLLPLNNISRKSAVQGRFREQTPEETSRHFMSQYWRFHGQQARQDSDSCCGSISRIFKTQTESGTYIYSRILTHGLTISCMPFQDVWNIDLERLKGCCGHVVTPGRQIMPFCSLYLTNAHGERLYKSGKDGTMLYREVAARQS